MDIKLNARILWRWNIFDQHCKRLNAVCKDFVEYTIKSMYSILVQKDVPKRHIPTDVLLFRYDDLKPQIFYMPMRIYISLSLNLYSIYHRNEKVPLTLTQTFLCRQSTNPWVLRYRFEENENLNGWFMTQREVKKAQSRGEYSPDSPTESDLLANFYTQP